MRLNRVISLLIIFVSLVVSVELVLSSDVSAVDSRSATGQIASANTKMMSKEVHVLNGGFWRTDGGFVSTIRIKNVLVVAPIHVTPTIFMADGTPYSLPSLTVPISGVATVNINDALASAPRKIAAHISQFGSLALVYKYPTPGHVVATLAAIDVPRSLSFVYMIDEPMPMQDDNMSKFLEGLWWKHDHGVRGTVSISNTTDERRTATLRSIQEAEESDERQIDLAPHTTQVLALEQFSRAASNEDNRVGGVRLEYKGPFGAIMIAGSLMNEAEGYSANMPFGSSDLTNSPLTKISLGSAGIMAGKPDAVMMPGFPTGTRFTPYTVLRNTTAKPLDISLALNYTHGTTPVNRNLPAQRLRPFEAKIVDLPSTLHAEGLKTFDGTINLALAFTGRASDLVLATGGVDQTGTYVFEVRPQVIGPSIGTITGYWSVANGDDSMFSLWNPTDSSQDMIATLYYGDGSDRYHFPVHLGPQASIMIDIAMLIREKVRDIDGKVIPSNIGEGSASFDTAGRDDTTPDHKKFVRVVISGGLFNVAAATCGMTCSYCNGYSTFVLNPSTLSCPAGCTAQFGTHATDSYGTLQTLAASSWSSNNTGVMTVNSSGTARAVGVGGTYIVADLYGVITWQGMMCVSDNMTPNCNPQNEFPSAPVNVTAPTATITIRFANPRASNLSFPASTTCSQSLGVFSCSTDWAYNVEVQAVVSDDASKWTISQTEESSRVKGTYTDATPGLHPINTTQSIACPPCDGPLAGFFQQTAGQKNIFYIDAPTINKTLLPGQKIFSATRISNFTAHFCSTVVPTACYTQPYFIKIVINGTLLDTANSTAGLGTMSTVF
jgi:hypothetical protein